jgi:hypothetical protein
MPVPSKARILLCGIPFVHALKRVINIFFFQTVSFFSPKTVSLDDDEMLDENSKELQCQKKFSLAHREYPTGPEPS